MASVLYRVLFLLVIIPFLALVGCSSTLTTIQRESTLDKMEIANGQNPGDGNHAKRELDLAADQIYHQPIDAEAHKGLLILVANWSSGLKTFKIWRDKEWWEVFGEPTLVASFILQGGGSEEYRLMPGMYLIQGWEGSEASGRYLGGVWHKLTSAPVITDVKTPSGKKQYHGVWGFDGGRYYGAYRY